MTDRATVVLDVGKTLSKLGLWAPDGTLIQRRSRPNQRVIAHRYSALDTKGIEQWLETTLREFAGLADIGAIIPVGHGAAAAVIGPDRLAQPSLDYEHPIPVELRREYDSRRDPFAQTGSPALPDGLNLGAQLYFLESLIPAGFASDSMIVPWAQYWSWLLSGVAATEVTTLGCHTDLWRPIEHTYSALAHSCGWSDRFAPMRSADAALGRLSVRWATRTGLPSDVQIHCGLHDSNAAVVAARGFPEIAAADSSVLSTGTWFVAMRTPAPGTRVLATDLSETRDCLINVNVAGNPLPSARFMGGREIELLTGLDSRRIDASSGQRELVDASANVLTSGAMVLPTFAPGYGPYPRRGGCWLAMPANDTERRAAVCLYAALVADATLDLVGARDRILIEGRFAAADVFVRALASLRTDCSIYVAPAQSDVSFGALRVLNPELRPAGPLTRVQPLTIDLTTYRNRWHEEIATRSRDTQ